MQIVSEIVSFYTPPHDSGGVLWFHVGRPCVSLSVRFLFQDDNLSKHQWTSPNLVCALIWRSGPSCSKLTTSLVNDLLKFTSSDTQICWNFLLKKATHVFSAKNIRILYIESAKTVNEMTLNKLVKLKRLWTTGPWFGIANGQISSNFYRVICPWHDNGRTL